jgi:hypothetical protein
VARDIEADAKINDKSGPGLKKFEENVRRTGKNVDKEFDRFGKGAGESILKGIGAVSPKLAASLSKGIGDAATLGGPLLVAGLAGALPVITGLIGAAVTGGAAGAGIVGGVALAVRDSRVKAAGTTLGQNLLADLTQKADVFVTPLLGAIDLVDARFDDMGDTIDSIFANSSKFVIPLTESVLDFTESIAEGIDTAAGRAGPVMQGLNTGVRALGDSIESFFDDLSENADFNGQVLEETLVSLAFTVESTGRSLKFLGDVFGTIDKVIPINPIGKYASLLENEVTPAALNAAQGVLRNANGIQASGDAAETAAADQKLYEKALRDNAKAAEDAAAAQRSLFDDVTKVGAATDAAREAARKNGKTLDANTEKGRNNRNALSEQASALNAYRERLIKSGASAATVNGTITAQRNALIRTANSMGVTGQKATDLANRLLGIPTKRTTQVNVNTAQAAANARNIRQEIAQIRSKTVTITIARKLTGSNLSDSALKAALRKQGALAASDTFGYMAPGQVSRTGGPLVVESNFAINLDGRPLRSYADRTVAEVRARDRFRDRVGKR